MQNLNSEQQSAVEHHQGAILVLAGAGTGKTRVLTNRVSHLIKAHQVPANQILAVTFTNKATGEMRDRLTAMLGMEAKRVWIATFHSAALKILRYHASLLGYRPGFVVYDTDDSRGLMKQILKDLKIDSKKLSPKHYLNIIEWQKNEYISADDFEPTYQQKQEQMGEVYSRYQSELLKANAMDFNDLLFNCLTLLDKHNDVRSIFQRQLKYILVDEFQDTNLIQYKIIRHLAAPENNLLVVGDDDQSIYAFRGADIRNILSFEKDYPDTKIIKLEQNYRSTENILAVAHSVISKNKNRKPKKLWTAEEGGELVSLQAYIDETIEAARVAEQIAGLMPEYKLKDCAIFYRTNAQSRALEEALLESGLKYKIFGGFKFYDRREVKDLIAYLRFLHNTDDIQAFRRIINLPKRGIGVQTVQKILNHATEKNQGVWEVMQGLAIRNKKLQGFVSLIDMALQQKEVLSLSELLGRIISDSNFLSMFNAEDPKDLDRLENIKELQVIASKYDESSDGLMDFLDHIALMTATDTSTGTAEEDEENYISLMTLHTAKGLEFPVVFFTGLEDGLVPHSRAIDEGEIPEERRLCYVGMSRAKKKLILSYAESRGMAGGNFSYGGYRHPSRFLADIPQELIDSQIELAEPFLEGVMDESYDFEEEIPEEYITSFNSKKKKTKKAKKTSWEDLIAVADDLD